ncbi:MAG: M23 family metallopeptidase [Planctomycetes bacterium]|nr:M23 family metallopeptidase [Planctomycetota bacterium]
MRRLPLLGGLLVAFTVARGGEEAADRFARAAQRLAEAVSAADPALLRRDLGKEMSDFLTVEKAKPLLDGLAAEYGKVLRLDPPQLFPGNQAVCVARCERGALDIKFALDAQDKVVSLWFGPHVPPLPVPEKHETVLSLPFKGRWLVAWGGDTKELNYHHNVRNQRFAIDFLGADAEGRTRTGAGTRNEDYLCFGREILAPADGVVTEAIDGVRDNVPGSMNPLSAIGNAVIIRHREHEVSLLAHFKQGSVRVRAGDKVKKGQVLGLCGNSGNSSEPHIHFHLQNTPILQDGTGIKCLFDRGVVTRKGATAVQAPCSPIKGDIVASE